MEKGLWMWLSALGSTPGTKKKIFFSDNQIHKSIGKRANKVEGNRTGAETARLQRAGRWVRPWGHPGVCREGEADSRMEAGASKAESPRTARVPRAGLGGVTEQGHRRELGPLGLP